MNIPYKKGVVKMDQSVIDIMTFEGLPAGLVGSTMSAIDDFCLSVCVPPLDDMSKAPPLRWSACLAYVGKVAISKYIQALSQYAKAGIINDLKTPINKMPILNNNTPEGVRNGVRSLIPFYIWLCGLYNKIIIPDDFSSFCGYPIGLDGFFLGAEKEQTTAEQLEAPEQEKESLTNIEYINLNITSERSQSFADAFGVSGSGGGCGESLAGWKTEILNNLKERQNSAVGSVLLDTRYPSIVWDSKKLDKQTENVQNHAPIALKLADLPRLV